MEKDGRILGASIVVLGIAGYLVFHWLCPQYKPSLYWMIPVFYLLNAGLLYGITASDKKKGFPMYVHLVLKMVKLFGALLMLIVYIVFVKINILSFVITIGLFHMVYSVLETRFLLKLNKKKIDEAK